MEPFRAANDAHLLAQLASKIKDDKPHAASMHNCLLLHSRRHASAYTFYTLHAHPTAHVVMWLHKIPGRTTIALHCLEEEVDVLAEALRHTRLVAWDEAVFAYHVPTYLAEALQEVAVTKGGRRLQMEDHYAFTCNSDGRQDLRCRAGLRVCRLGAEGVRHMLATSKNDRTKPLDAMVHLARHAPCAAIYEAPGNTEYQIDVANLPPGPDDATPIAWITTSFYGALAILMTEEAWRGRGLGGLVTQVAAQMQHQQGYVPHAHVTTTNAASARMFTKLPGWTQSHTVFFALTK